MATITLKIDGDLLRRARIKALRDGTSVNEMLREHLQRYADEGAREAVAEFLRLSNEIDAGSGPGGRSWTARGALRGQAALAARVGLLISLDTSVAVYTDERHAGDPGNRTAWTATRHIPRPITAAQEPASP